MIINAFQYTPEKGKIELCISDVIVDLKKDIQIKVSDTGIGISDDEKQELFTAFFQSKRRKMLTSDSSGIGLMLTKELIDLHGDSITVTSEIGKGSVFTVNCQ